MRIPWPVALLGLGLGIMLGSLGGCGGGNEFPTAFTVTGIVATDGVPDLNAVVILLQNGQQLQQTTAAKNGSFRFTNIPALQTGTYALAVNEGENNVQSYVGPFNVIANRQIIINAPSFADLASLVPSVTRPTNDTVTLVVFANNPRNNPLQSFTVTVGTSPAVASTPGRSGFAVVTGITEHVTHAATVVVTDTTNQLTATVKNVSLPPDSLVYLQAIIPGG